MRSRAPCLGFVFALLLAVELPRPALASDVSDELSAGSLASSGVRGVSPFVSDRLGAAVDASDAMSFSADATFTRYFRSKGALGENILQLAAAADYTAGEHWSFGADVRGSPPSTVKVDEPATNGTEKYHSSLVGGGASVEYDTASEGALETIADAYLGLTAFRTTQPGKGMHGSPSSLLQWRGSIGLTEVLWQDTEAELTGTYYGYSEDPVDTGYTGPSVFGRGGVSEGAPLEPLRWAIRPGVKRRFGVLRFGAYVQYGRFVDDVGFSLLTAVKAQVKVSGAVRLWAQVGYQRDGGAGESLSIPWGSFGVRVVL